MLLKSIETKKTTEIKIIVKSEIVGARADLTNDILCERIEYFLDLEHGENVDVVEHLYTLHEKSVKRVIDWLKLIARDGTDGDGYYKNADIYIDGVMLEKGWTE
jgi:hypothetical protein